MLFRSLDNLAACLCSIRAVLAACLFLILSCLAALRAFLPSLPPVAALYMATGGYKFASFSRFIFLLLILFLFSRFLFLYIFTKKNAAGFLPTALYKIKFTDYLFPKFVERSTLRRNNCIESSSPLLTLYWIPYSESITRDCLISTIFC